MNWIKFIVSCILGLILSITVRDGSESVFAVIFSFFFWAGIPYGYTAIRNFLNRVCDGWVIFGTIRFFIMAFFMQILIGSMFGWAFFIFDVVRSILILCHVINDNKKPVTHTNAQFMNTSESDQDINYDLFRQTPENPQAKMTWRCPVCGRTNQGYVGTCGCGQSKP